MTEHFDYYNNFIYLLNYPPVGYNDNWGRDNMTFNLCLQAKDNLVLITDSRLVNTKTSGLTSDRQKKLYILSNYCGLMVSGNLKGFQSFINKLLDEILHKSDDLALINSKITKTILKEIETYNEFFKNAETINESFSNLNAYFTLLVSGYYNIKNVTPSPYMGTIVISKDTLPLIFHSENTARREHLDDISGDGFLLSGIEEDLIKENLKDKYESIFTPSLSEAKDWAFECYKKITGKYCTIGGKPQMAIIHPKNGFKFISDEEIEQNKSKWANVI